MQIGGSKVILFSLASCQFHGEQSIASFSFCDGRLTGPTEKHENQQSRKKISRELVVSIILHELIGSQIRHS